MSRPMPVEFARCDGTIFTDGNRRLCELKDTCLRHTCITPCNRSVVNVWVALDEGESCSSYVEDKQ